MVVHLHQRRNIHTERKAQTNVRHRFRSGVGVGEVGVGVARFGVGG